MELSPKQKELSWIEKLILGSGRKDLELRENNN
jgi:hypothetical protein